MVVERDRSQELYVLFDTLRQSSTSKGSTHGKSDARAPQNNEVERFNRYAQAFSMDIANISDSIGRLTKLISRQNVFDDQSSEISTLTQVVKASLQRLHNDLYTLEELKKRSIDSQKNGQHSNAFENDRFFSGGAASHLQTSQKHSDVVVDTLKNRLARTGQQFRSTLQHQSMNIKTNASRRQFFTAVDRPQTFESALFQDQEQHSQMQLAVGMGNAQYYQQRAEAVSEIESAVAEVGELFKDFTRLVHEQDEVILRIDSDVGSALDNVNVGTNELMRYLTSISSNRGLILKIFAVIFFFLMFFGFVVVR
ncbi:unnamed protein product [Phytomonas sp. Hart1]|nr:unnamed protein product [Phytomonas sp. Hart1]|eukprot:CCW70508.1 unnamed protein product [Phytomonas sp. isolate Hart1]